MTSAAPARKPYRKAPPQHRETRHAPPVALPAPAPQHDPSQVKQHSPNTRPSTLRHRSAGAEQPPSYRGQRGGPQSDSELDLSSLSSLELCAPPSGRFTRQGPRTPRARARTPQSPARVRRPSPGHRLPEERCRSTPRPHAAAAAAPRSILKQPGCLGVKHTYDVIRKSQSEELLGDGRGEDAYLPARSPLSSDPPSPCGTGSGRKAHVLKEKVRFSNFLDEITCRVMSPVHLSMLGKLPSVRARGRPAGPAGRERRSEETPAQRSRRWDRWVSAVQRPGVLDVQEEAAAHRRGDRVPWKREKGVKRDVEKRHKHSVPLSDHSVLSHYQVGLHGPPVGPEAPGGTQLHLCFLENLLTRKRILCVMFSRFSVVWHHTRRGRVWDRGYAGDLNARQPAHLWLLFVF